jgi:putative redox protein
MVVVREKTSVTQRIHGDCPTHSRTEISVRDVCSIIDEPKERDGTNMGPTPTETMVAALIACTNVISHKCAKKHGVEFKAMTIDAESTFDRRGTQLLEEIEVPFPKIRLVINVTTDTSESAMEKVKADLHRFCPVSKVVRNGARGGLERDASLNAHFVARPAGAHRRLRVRGQ